MKKLTNLLACFSIILLLISCKKNTLNIAEDKETINAIPYNFLVLTNSGIDQISKSGQQTYSFYLRQQEMYVAGQIYKLSFKCGDFYDGKLTVNGYTWRQGDVISIDYDQVKNNNFLFEGSYQPIPPSVGSYSITFIITDRFGKTKTAVKKINVTE